ncbi:MAG: ABC transporter permease [Gammaproteobacteria bacterium]|nr:ABC transporter permease [Gammaproteobacteria bacterium]
MSRNRFFVFITVLGLLSYIALFWALPSTVDETIRLGVHGTGIETLLAQLGDQEGLALTSFETSEALQTAVEEKQNKLAAGIDFPDDFLSSVAAGRQTTVKVFVPADTPPEIRDAMRSMVRELAFLVAGNQPPVSVAAEEDVVLGPDRVGDQVSMQERMRPLLAIFALMMEMFALAALIAQEIRSRTVTAVLATPARMSDFLAAKTLLGTGLAFAEVALLMAAIRSFAGRPLVLVVALLLGAFLVTGFALLAGATGKDFIEILFWSMFLMIPMMIPAGAALFPGTAATWIQMLPSYGMTEAIVRATSYGAGWSETAPFFAMTLAWCAVAFGAGLFALKRKVEML